MSELVKVKMLSMTLTSRYGTLSAGDELRTDAAYAKHLVEECGAAEYIKPARGAAPVEPPAPVEKPLVPDEKNKPHPKK